MSAWMRDSERKTAMQRRRKPGTGRILSIPFAGLRRIPFDTEPPTELHLEATGPSGEVATWLDDFFWLDVLQHWPSQPLEIHLLPSPDALLNPVIHHQLFMLRRVAPAWRLVGHCCADDLADEHALTTAALSPYHELQVHEGPSADSPGQTATRLEDVVAGIRSAQSVHNRVTPIVVCRPSARSQAKTRRAQEISSRQTSAATTSTDRTLATAK